MSDEEVDLDEATPIEIDVGPGTALDVDVGSLSALDVALATPTACTTELSQALPIDVQPAQVQPIDVSPGETDPVDVIVGLIMGLTAEQFDRLNAAIGNLEVNPYKVFSWPGLGTAFSANDWTPLTLTSTYKMVTYGPIPRDAWRDSGVLHIHARVRVTDAIGTGAGVVWFSLQSAPMPVAGVYQAYTQHMQQGVIVSSDGFTPSVLNATLACDIDVSGSASDAWDQNATGLTFGWSGAAAFLDDINQPFSPAYDPTEMRFFSLWVKFIPTAAETAKAISASCWLMNPRDGTCHAL